MGLFWTWKLFQRQFLTRSNCDLFWQIVAKMLRILDCQKWKCFLIFQKERLKVPTHLFGIVNKIAFFSCISTESCGTFLFDFEEQVIYFQVKFRFRFLSTTKYSRNKLPAQKLTCRNWFYRSETKIKEISPCVMISKIIFGSFVDWERIRRPSVLRFKSSLSVCGC